MSKGFFQLQDVLDAARDRWEYVLGSLGVRTELLTGKHGPCPGCGGRDRFRWDNKGGDGSFICSQGGGGNLSGNGLTLLEHVHGWDFRRVLEEVGSLVLGDERRVVWHGSGSGGGLMSVEELRRREEERAVPVPAAERVAVPPYNEEALRAYVQPVGKITREDLRAVSPLPVERCPVEDFLEALYFDKERVLIFTEFYSQGNYLYQVGSGTCKLSADKGVKAVVSPLPRGGREGVWFLSNPVTGRWDTKGGEVRYKRVPMGHHGPPERLLEEPEWSRRHWKCVTSYRYAVLESDSAPEELWLRALWRLPLPIVAIYTSGGKSVHALLRVDASSKAEWDLMVRGICDGSAERVTSLMSLVCPLGGDPNALSAVRLSRLPKMYREGVTVRNEGYKRYEKPREQELLYLRYVRPGEKVAWRSLEMGGAR